jgi:hypothetical protein
LVYLTKRGWQSIDVHRAAVRALEAQWADQIGARRFEEFKEALAKLVSLG